MTDQTTPLPEEIKDEIKKEAGIEAFDAKHGHLSYDSFFKGYYTGATKYAQLYLSEKAKVERLEPELIAAKSFLRECVIRLPKSDFHKELTDWLELTKTY